LEPSANVLKSERKAKFRKPDQPAITIKYHYCFVVAWSWHVERDGSGAKLLALVLYSVPIIVLALTCLLQAGKTRDKSAAERTERTKGKRKATSKQAEWPSLTAFDIRRAAWRKRRKDRDTAEHTLFRFPQPHTIKTLSTKEVLIERARQTAGAVLTAEFCRARDL